MLRETNHFYRPPATRAMREARRARGFSLVEILVVLAILAVLLALLFPIMRRARVASQSVACLSHLKQIHTAFVVFAHAHDHRFPDPGITGMSWESSLLPYTRANLYECPADGEQYPSMGSSYDWRDTPDPATTLAGKDMAEATRAALVLAFDVLPGWHGTSRVNVVLLDGSAREMDFEEYAADLLAANNLQSVPRKQKVDP